MAKHLRRLPWGLIGMIGLVLPAERFVARHGERFLDVDHWAYARSARAASRDVARYDVLCLGDSLMKLGVVPRAVGERSGLRVYNLAVSGSQSPSSYFLLRRVLDSGARPKAVLVDFHTTLLMLGPRHNRGLWPSLIGPAEAAALGWWARDPQLFAEVSLGRWLPSYLGRFGIRASLLGALSGKGDDRPFNNSQYLRNWARNAGAQLHPAGPGLADLTDAQVDELCRGYYPRWECDPTNAVGIERLLSLARAHGVRVYWVLPPLMPRVQDRLARSGFDRDHEAFLRSWQERFPNLFVLDGRRKVQDPAGFFDLSHLSAEGAYGFSLALGDVLRRSLPQDDPEPPDPGARWVPVAACRPVPLPGEVESVPQSALALRSRAASRR